MSVNAPKISRSASAKASRTAKCRRVETAHVEKQEQHINQQVKSDREANGGKLTPSEKKQVNKEQNKTSKEIHKDKNSKK